MEQVLHIEPIVRHVPAPAQVGHSELLFYGEPLTSDDENVGHISSMMTLGAPLEFLTTGGNSHSVPLVKTVEYAPDLSRDQGHTFLETVYYKHGKHSLIPFRTKLRSGLGDNLRLTHIPSLNMARHLSTGALQPVCDPRSTVVTDLILHDDFFKRRKNDGLENWLMYELQPALDNNHYTALSVDSAEGNDMIPKYINQVRDTPTDFTSRDLRYITDIISPAYRNVDQTIPRSFFNPDANAVTLQQARFNLVPNSFDFRSYGSIPVGKLDRIEHDARLFQDICDALDFIPFTDFNVDFVVEPSSEIVLTQVHLAINRFTTIEGVNNTHYEPATILREYLDEEFLNDVLERFNKFHSNLNDEIREIINYEPVKIKIMKTMSDEAAILLYHHDSRANEPPLCGVYFDIALQSLAPMSIMPVPIPN